MILFSSPHGAVLELFPLHSRFAVSSELWHDTILQIVLIKVTLMAALLCAVFLSGWWRSRRSMTSARAPIAA